MDKAFTKQEFYEKVVPVIVELAKKNGYKLASPIIAQAICESNTGKSSLGYKYYNFFGLKCGSKWSGKSVNMKTKEEYTVGTLTTIKDNFRAWNISNNIDECIRAGVQGYFDFINTKRYANLKTAETPEEYLQMIKADGYATSSTYVQTNLNIIEKNGLRKYDAGFSNMKEETIIKDPVIQPVSDEAFAVIIKTNGSNLRLRKEPSTNCAVLGYIPNGTKVSVISVENNGNWYKTEYNGKVGYISKTYTKKA